MHRKQLTDEQQSIEVGRVLTFKH